MYNRDTFKVRVEVRVLVIKTEKHTYETKDLLNVIQEEEFETSHQRLAASSARSLFYEMSDDVTGKIYEVLGLPNPNSFNGSCVAGSPGPVNPPEPALNPLPESDDRLPMAEVDEALPRHLAEEPGL